MEQEKEQERKLSKANLTFYVISLAIVAIGLILISYIAQVRSNQQLEKLSSQLSEQASAAQGTAQKMEQLQQKMDSMTTTITQMRKILRVNDEQDLLAIAQARMEENTIYQALGDIALLVLDQNIAPAEQALGRLVEAYGIERFTDKEGEQSSIGILYQTLVEQIEFQKTSAALAEQEQVQPE